MAGCRGCRRGEAGKRCAASTHRPRARCDEARYLLALNPTPRNSRHTVPTASPRWLNVTVSAPLPRCGYPQVAAWRKSRGFADPGSAAAAAAANSSAHASAPAPAPTGGEPTAAGPSGAAAGPSSLKTTLPAAAAGPAGSRPATGVSSSTGSRGSGAVAPVSSSLGHHPLVHNTAPRPDLSKRGRSALTFTRVRRAGGKEIVCLCAGGQGGRMQLACTYLLAPFLPFPLSSPSSLLRRSSRCMNPGQQQPVRSHTLPHVAFPGQPCFQDKPYRAAPHVPPRR